MAIFKRTQLKDKGLTDEQIDFVMNEAGRVFAGYTPTADVQAQIDAAVEAAKQAIPAPVQVKDSDEYKALLAENTKIKAFQTDDFAAVKAPYRDFVWDKLDHGEKHAAYSEQIAALAEQMPDIFNAQASQQPAEPAKPQFGAPAQGTMPAGKQTPSFGDAWGFVPKSAN